MSGCWDSLSIVAKGGAAETAETSDIGTTRLRIIGPAANTILFYWQRKIFNHLAGLGIVLTFFDINVSIFYRRRISFFTPPFTVPGWCQSGCCSPSLVFVLARPQSLIYLSRVLWDISFPWTYVWESFRGRHLKSLCLSLRKRIKCFRNRRNIFKMLGFNICIPFTDSEIDIFHGRDNQVF